MPLKKKNNNDKWSKLFDIRPHCRTWTVFSIMDGIRYTLQWAAPSPSQNCPFPWGICIPIWYMVLQTHPSLNQLSHFCRAHDRDRPTDRQTMLLVCNNRPPLHTQCYDVAGWYAAFNVLCRLWVNESQAAELNAGKIILSVELLRLMQGMAEYTTSCRSSQSCWIPRLRSSQLRTSAAWCRCSSPRWVQTSAIRLSWCCVLFLARCSKPKHWALCR